MSMKDFQIQSKLGDGSYSSVYKVRRLVNDRIYALKKVKLQNLSNRQIQNAVNQVRFLASIRHPNIICYKQAFYDPATRSLCIVMEYAQNGDLLQKIFQKKRNGSQFQEEYIWDIFIQIVKGLGTLHELKITHRDIKSANVFLGKNGIAKLGDFNVSKVIKKGMMCQTQTGTPYYASPEVWKDQPYDMKSDLWSLGCVLYEFINLKPPFRARDMDGLCRKVVKGYYSKISRSYSSDLSEVLKLLINSQPSERISCKDLLEYPIMKKHLKKAKQLQILEEYSLIRTIKLSKNINYLTQKLPKPNYSPIKYKSLKRINYSLSIDIKKKKNYPDSSLPKIEQRRHNSLALSERGSLKSRAIKRRYELNNVESLPKILNKKSSINKRLY